MKTIELTGRYSGHHMLVDDEIHEIMIRFGPWHGHMSKGNVLYSRKTTRPYGRRGKTVNVLAHRQAGVLYGILKSLDDPFQIDHIDHDCLNNTKANLRAVTNQENGRNKRKRPGGTSRFKGVSWNKKYDKWMAQIKSIRGRTLGYFTDEIWAAKAFDNAARKLGYLESALNFPEENGTWTSNPPT